MTKKSERTRQRIIEAANRLFYHQGYHNTSFSEVVESCGVPRGNIYYYFKTKDEILLAAIEHRLERVGNMLREWSESYPTPIERLRRFLDILPNSADALTRYGCPMGTLNSELGKDDPALQQRARALFQQFEDWLADQFAELGYAGRAKELARRLLARGQGISILTQVYGDTDYLAQETILLRDWLEKLAKGDDRCT